MKDIGVTIIWREKLRGHFTGGKTGKMRGTFYSIFIHRLSGTFPRAFLVTFSWGFSGTCGGETLGISDGISRSASGLPVDFEFYPKCGKNV
jgi:hypothetical protein